MKKKIYNHTISRMYNHWAVLLLCLINSLTFILFNIFGLCPVVDLGYQRTTTAVISEPYYTLITALFVHQTFSHITSNLIGILLFGTLSKYYINNYGVILLYIIAGGMSTVVNSLISPLGTITLGGSGGVYALFIVGMLTIYNNPTYSEFPKKIEEKIVILFTSFVIVDQIRKLIFSDASVAFEAHITGIIIGLITVFIIQTFEK